MGAGLATKDPVTDRARPAHATRIWRVFVALVLLLFAGYLVRTITDEPYNGRPFLAIGAILSGASIVLAWLAQRAWTKIGITALRWALTLVLAWHALFGPVMLATRIVTDVTSNRQPVMVLWPHVVSAINSLE